MFAGSELSSNGRSKTSSPKVPKSQFRPRAASQSPVLDPRKAQVHDDGDFIKHQSKVSPAGRTILAMGKGIYVIGTFGAFHLLKRTQMSPLEFVTFTLTISAALLCGLHRPWRLSKNRRPNLETLKLAWKTAASTVCVHWLLAFGLEACAPVRFLILEHLEVLLTYCMAMLLGAKEVHPTKVQGGVLIFAGYVVCLWHDTTPIRASAAAGIIVEAPLIDEVDETNTYDSFVGTCAIGLAAFVAVTARHTERQLCAHLGSLKRVHALQASLALTILWPVVALQRLLGSSHSSEVPEISNMYEYPMIVFVALAFCTVRFALASMQQNLRVPDNQASRTSVAVVTIFALFIHTLHSWDTLIAPPARMPVVIDSLAVQDSSDPTQPRSVNSTEVRQGHTSSRRSLIEMAALVKRTSPEDASSAFAVYVAAALVAAGVFRFTTEGGEQQLSHLAQQVLPVFDMAATEGLMLPAKADASGAVRDSPGTRLLRHLWRHRATRRPLGYLSVSFVFMLFELVFGWIAGAPSLISDAGHVFVDVVAAGVALAAAHASSKPPSSTFAYGGARAEVLGGFINALLLSVSAFGLVMGAVRRAQNEVGTQAWASERLLIVHIMGLAINGCGLALFHQSDSENPVPSAKRPSQNTRGMFLHVLADTLGTIVIVLSSLVQHYHGWTVFDPIASFLVACLLGVLAMPLLKTTVYVLLQRQPLELDATLGGLCGRVEQLGGVCGVEEIHFWCLTPRHLTEGSLRITIPEVMSSEERSGLLDHIVELFRPVKARVLVQVERTAGFNRSSSQ